MEINIYILILNYITKMISPIYFILMKPEPIFDINKN